MYTYYAIGGAAVVCALFLVGLAVLAWCVDKFLKARKWERFARVCGGEKAAMRVLELSEATFAAETDELMTKGFKSARKLGLLPEKFL
jgi:hypothetical protein